MRDEGKRLICFFINLFSIKRDLTDALQCITMNHIEKEGDYMNSQLTVRLPDRLEKDVSILAKKLHLKRADIVRMALESFVKQAKVKEER